MKATEVKNKATVNQGNGHAVKAKSKKTVKAAKASLTKNGQKPARKKKELTPEEVFLQAWHLIYDNYHQGNRLD